MSRLRAFLSRRRRVLRGVIVLLVVTAAACSPAAPPALQEFRLSRKHMGTEVTLTVLHASEETARAAIVAAFAEIERLEATLSPYRASSEVARLNRAGSFDAGPETLFVIGKALHFHRLSGGAFDISVQPILDLYGRSFASGAGPPGDEEIRRTLELVDAGAIEISGNRISMPPGMQITPGGIAKGYAVDRAAAVLRERGIHHGLVNAGGDMAAIGRNRTRPWSIALKDPRRSGFVTVLPLEDRAVATSGDYERFFEPSRRFHHIIDPRTGYSATELASVTVVAGTALAADALATSLFVLGPTAGLELVETLPSVEALLVTPAGEVLMSSGLETRCESASSR